MLVEVLSFTLSGGLLLKTVRRGSSGTVEVTHLGELLPLPFEPLEDPGEGDGEGEGEGEDGGFWFPPFPWSPPLPWFPPLPPLELLGGFTGVGVGLGVDAGLLPAGVEEGLSDVVVGLSGVLGVSSRFPKIPFWAPSVKPHSLRGNVRNTSIIR